MKIELELDDLKKLDSVLCEKLEDLSDDAFNSLMIKAMQSYFPSISSFENYIETLISTKVFPKIEQLKYDIEQFKYGKTYTSSDSDMPIVYNPDRTRGNMPWEYDAINTAIRGRLEQMTNQLTTNRNATNQNNL